MKLKYYPHNLKISVSDNIYILTDREKIIIKERKKL